MHKNSPPPVRTANRLALFPDSIEIRNDALSIAGHDLASLANRYETPLYVYDRATLDGSLAEYQAALSTFYPSLSHITYAGKAFLCKAIAEWTQAHDLFVDCTGEGEISIVMAAGVPRRNILVHGVNKSTKDIASALQHAETIVVDNLPELYHLHGILREHGDQRTSATASETSRGADLEQDRRVQSDLKLWLRLLPGVAVTTHHAHTQTGQRDSKFGMTAAEILEAARYCREHNLPLKGIHFHLGSNFRDPEPLLPAIDMALDLARDIGFSGEWHFCPGGGWSVAYHEEELPGPSIESYVRGIAEAVVEGCQHRGLDLPQLHLEPGRSLIARAGVAIYRVGAVKRREGRTWLLIDGGMADNPRHALYGSRYSCLTVAGVGRESSEFVSIGGPFCESGDVLIEDILLPRVDEGELIAIPVAGAYQLSMSSNYNGARRPAVLLLEEGQTKLIQKRETVEDLLRRDADQ